MDKDRLNRIEDKLDRISEKIEEINVTMAENTKSLVIHEKRTDLAESRIALTELQLKEMATRNKIVLDNIEEKVEPIHKHVTVVNVLVTYVLPAIAAILAFLFKVGIIK